jgi:hypothetical protein
VIHGKLQNVVYMKKKMGGIIGSCPYVPVHMGYELCLATLATQFQLYRGRQFYWLRKPEYPEKNTYMSQVTDKLNHIMLYWVHFAMNRVQTQNYWW